MPKIEEELGIAHAAAGSFFLLISTGYFITLLGSGFFSSRLTHRRTIILSGAVLGAALLGTSFIGGLFGIPVLQSQSGQHLYGRFRIAVSRFHPGRHRHQAAFSG